MFFELEIEPVWDDSTSPFTPGNWLGPDQWNPIVAELVPAIRATNRQRIIVVDAPISAQPALLVFLFPQGSSSTIPGSYEVQVSTCDSWSASSSQGWVKLTPASGIGPGNFTAYLEGFPTNPGIYQATITVETQTPPQQAQVQVTLVVTGGALEQSCVPLVSKP